MLFNIFQHSLVTFTLADLMKFRCGAKEKKKYCQDRKFTEKITLWEYERQENSNGYPRNCNNYPQKQNFSYYSI